MDKVKALFDVNLFAAMAMVQSFLPLLLASNHARIVQMGSLAGVMPVPFGAAYNASKAALHSFGDTLRVELAPFKCVSCLSIPQLNKTFSIFSIKVITVSLSDFVYNECS